MDVDDAIAEVYGAPPQEFVAIRDRLAREAADQGDRAVAARIKGLRKPPLSVWAVNQVARRHPADVRALVDAGRRLVDATRTHDPDGVRKASAERRSLVARLVEYAGEALGDAGRKAGGTHLERASRTLYNAAVDEEASAALLRGALLSDVEAEAGGLLPAPVEGAPEDDGRKRRKTAELEALRRAAGDAQKEAVRLERIAVRAEAEAARAREAAETARRSAERARARVEERLSERR